MLHWYALYTQPHKERQVEGLLAGRGAETYLPTAQRKVRRRDRPERVIYFPCYLFARLDFSDTPHSSIAWMPGVRHIVTLGEQPAIVADEIVNLIRGRLEKGALTGYSHLKPGDRVRFCSGPLRDLEAIFDRPLSATDRVRVLLDVMGRLTPVDADYMDILPL